MINQGSPSLKFRKVEYKSINYPMNNCCSKKKGAAKIVHRQRYPTGINGFMLITLVVIDLL